MSFRRGASFAAVLLGLALPAVASAGLLDSGAGWSPRVPVSALARPATWFDPSRLQISSLVSVGSGGFGGTSALQVTSLSYRFDAPVSMSVSLGNAWGGTGDGRSAFFLEGFNLQYRPNPSMQFQVQFRDLRSPLQLQSGPSGFWGW